MLSGTKVPSRKSFLYLGQCLLTPNFRIAAASLTPASIWEMRGHESYLWMCWISYWTDQWKIMWMEVPTGKCVRKVLAGGDAVGLLHQLLIRDPGWSKIWSSLTCAEPGLHPVDWLVHFCSIDHLGRPPRKCCYFLPISSKQTLSELADYSFSNLDEFY